MGKKEISDSLEQYFQLLEKVKDRDFSPLYLFMGEEPFFGDTLISKIVERALLPEEKSFNYTLLYGSGVTAAAVVEAARRYPMMAPRQVVVVKEAQALIKGSDLEHYFRNPSPTTILILAYSGKGLDKRGSLYKSAKGGGVVHLSFTLSDREAQRWVERIVKEGGASITPEASTLLLEHCGTSLRKLSLELEKLIASLEEGSSEIELSHVEKNSGLSREFSLFELNRALSFRAGDKIATILHHFKASSSQYPIQLIVATLFSHFFRVLKYHAISHSQMGGNETSKAHYIGVNPYFIGEYRTASINYSPLRCMEIINRIRRSDRQSKSSERGEASDWDLIRELIAFILK
ncbi:MAG: DNA polymerase III subunit delta [Bacteroidales bacterium]